MIWNIFVLPALLLLQRDPGGLAQGFVDLDLGCSTILLGQAVASYSSGPPAGGTPKIQINKTLCQTTWVTLYTK